MSKNNLFNNVFITPECWRKLNLYATAAIPNEIGGLARIQEGDDGDIFVVDVEMMPQVASPGTFDITATDIGAFTQRLVDEGRLDELSEWKSIVHSHPVGMSAHMSGVDVEAIKRFAEEQEAFSLIISGSRSADSTDLLMHYCCNVRGKHIIVSDLKVDVCSTGERIGFAEEFSEKIVAELGLSDVAVRKRAVSSVYDCLIDLPFEFDKGEEEKISLEVKNLVKSYSHHLSNYQSSAFQRNGRDLSTYQDYQAWGQYDSYNGPTYDTPNTWVQDELGVWVKKSELTNELDAVVADRYELLYELLETGLNPESQEPVSVADYDKGFDLARKLLLDYPDLRYWANMDDLIEARKMFLKEGDKV